MNFGAFATPEEIILFDINDFDETLPGVDFTVDVKRLATSVAVAALDAKFSGRRARAAAATTVAAYRMRMRTLAKPDDRLDPDFPSMKLHNPLRDCET
jgi:uncharacterized protein (DUF2252 family)